MNDRGQKVKKLLVHLLPVEILGLNEVPNGWRYVLWLLKHEKKGKTGIAEIMLSAKDRVDMLLKETTSKG